MIPVTKPPPPKEDVVWSSLLLPPATKLRQGNVFTPVCHSVNRGEVCHTPLGRPPWTDTPWADTPWADTNQAHNPLSRQPLDRPPGQTPPWADPPVQCVLGYGQQAGGTHPTAMHSC